MLYIRGYNRYEFSEIRIDTYGHYGPPNPGKKTSKWWQFRKRWQEHWQKPKTFRWYAKTAILSLLALDAVGHVVRTSFVDFTLNTKGKPNVTAVVNPIDPLSVPLTYNDVWDPNKPAIQKPVIQVSCKNGQTLDFQCVKEVIDGNTSFAARAYENKDQAILMVVPKGFDKPGEFDAIMSTLKDLGNDFLNWSGFYSFQDKAMGTMMKELRTNYPDHQIVFVGYSQAAMLSQNAMHPGDAASTFADLGQTAHWENLVPSLHRRVSGNAAPVYNVAIEQIKHADLVADGFGMGPHYSLSKTITVPNVGLPGLNHLTPNYMTAAEQYKKAYTP